jgi:hypothetical protein
MAEHSIYHGHQIQFGNIMMLVKLPHYTSRVIHKPNEISLHDKCRKEGGYQLSQACKNIIHILKEERGCHSHTQAMNPSSGPVTAL